MLDREQLVSKAVRVAALLLLPTPLRPRPRRKLTLVDDGAKKLCQSQQQTMPITATTTMSVSMPVSPWFFIDQRVYDWRLWWWFCKPHLWSSAATYAALWSIIHLAEHPNLVSVLTFLFQDFIFPSFLRNRQWWWWWWWWWCFNHINFVVLWLAFLKDGYQSEGFLNEKILMAFLKI